MLVVGVDLIEIRRIEGVLSRHGNRFLDRVFTEAERSHCAGRAEALATRWAAKEAAAKALGTGIGDVRWRDIEVWCDERGKPHLRLHGGAQALAQSLGITELAVSLAHEGGQAIAFVVGIGHSAAEGSGQEG
ncbi:MAG: holo-[acyl-carrier-protein] synthase [Chloroflexi bacterium]|nr:MAG: holo-[acyl-carrier-protein] synthase [Chloroflexota bacterium]